MYSKNFKWFEIWPKLNHHYLMSYQWNRNQSHILTYIFQLKSILPKTLRIRNSCKMRVPTSAYLTRLRKLMISEVPSLAAYIVPSCDAHNSEYLAPCDERRSFISGFNGSAGTAVITSKDALLWTDGRYFLQASSQMDDNWTLMKVILILFF